MTTPRISFEFFPPQSLDASFRLWETVQALAPMQPSFVSVTYGAGGTTRTLTHEAVSTIHRNYGLPVAAHLTCVDATQTETLAIAEAYAAAGVTEIVALRGDAPKGAQRFVPHPLGFANSVELVEKLARTGKFKIRVGAYPEPHPDAADSTSDVTWLKRKIDAGASRAITQFFFDNDIFERYVDRVRAAGIDIPIVPGIIPVLDFERTAGFARRAGASVPAWLAHRFEGLERDDKTRQLVAATVAAEQCFDLVKRGYRDFHFYTRNRADLVYAIGHLLGLRPVTDAKAAAAASPVGAAA